MENGFKTKADLETLIRNEAQESLKLEFKRSAALGKSSTQRIELSKDVSSFANSAGGTIIYGIVEKDHVAKSIDETGTDPDEIPKEWIEQVINSTISKRIDGITITPIKLNEGGKLRVAYVLNIPKSNRAPHQASDKKFYKRFNFTNIPMEEYEIEDLRRRDVAPNLSAGLLIKNSHLAFDRGANLSLPISLNLYVENDSDALALYTLVDIFLDQRIQIDQTTDYDIANNREITVNGQSIKCTRATYKCAVPEHFPIWSGQQYVLPALISRFPKAPTGASYFMCLRVSSPGMAAKTECRVIDQGSTHSLKLSDVLDDDTLVSRMGL